MHQGRGNENALLLIPDEVRVEIQNDETRNEKEYRENPSHSLVMCMTVKCRLLKPYTCPKWNNCITTMYEFIVFADYYYLVFFSFMGSIGLKQFASSLD